MANAPAGAIRRFYTSRMTPVLAGRAKRDVLALLEDRKDLQRAADALLDAALPYSGDPRVKAAIERLRGMRDA